MRPTCSLSSLPTRSTTSLLHKRREGEGEGEEIKGGRKKVSERVQNEGNNDAIMGTDGRIGEESVSKDSQ